MDASRSEIEGLIKHAGKYELHEENQEGMNAYSFKARHKPLDRDVFLKVYDASPEREDIFAEPKLLVEATCESGNCKYLVEVLDAEKISDEWVLVAMEFVDRGSILKFLRSNGHLPLMDSLSLIRNILEGLVHLHKSYFVHRDIKPANIMLANHNGSTFAKIGDFGSMAKLKDANSTTTASRHSALYVPPEGWKNPSIYCIQSDLYQVGLVLYEMINGSLPYNPELYLDRHSISEIKSRGYHSYAELNGFEKSKIVDATIARRSSNGSLLSLKQPLPYYNMRLKRIVNKAIHPIISKRFRSATEMLSSINTLHMPNWCMRGDAFEARNWNSWDWVVQQEYERGAKKYSVKKSRPMNFNFRKVHSNEDITNAIEYVNRFK